MELAGRSIALYGRFSPGLRDRLAREVQTRGGEVARDLTRRSSLLVVGGRATALAASGALGTRLAAARKRDVQALGERAFARGFAGEAAPAATLPLAAALGGAQLDPRLLEPLALFDLITLSGDHCAFADAATIRTAAELSAAGRAPAEVIAILTRARDLAPAGRRRIVLTPRGEAALAWDDGLTTLEGQAILPLDDDQASLEDLFEAAALAEAAGDLGEAARLYDLCGRIDRADPMAPFNLGNIRLDEGAPGQAALAYQQALARDPGFTEARYNLAQALEADGKPEAAESELRRVLAADPAYADALFNLAQLRLAAGAKAEARGLYERYLSLGPPAEWAATARKAILYCSSPD